MKKLYLNDLVLNILIILLCISVPICLSVLAHNEEKTVLISVNGETVKELPLSEDAQFHINGVNVEIKDGKASVPHSDCPDGLCTKMKKAENIGDSIICVPNMVSVRVAGSGVTREADVIAG